MTCCVAHLQGYDTQSVVFSTLILYLAMHQEYQTKLYEEMVSIFGDSDREVCEDDLKKMTYVEMCLKEALRHTTPAAVIRKVDDDIEIGTHAKLSLPWSVTI